jgi:hypothetical protein
MLLRMVTLHELRIGSLENGRITIYNVTRATHENGRDVSQDVLSLVKIHLLSGGHIPPARAPIGQVFVAEAWPAGAARCVFCGT